MTRPADAPPAWERPELANPHANQDKPGKVRRMFAAIAPSYDLNNHLHSLWQDQRWRKFAVRQARVRPGDVVIDVACGTGDLSQAFARAGAGRVIGIDFTHEMLDVAERKRRSERRPDVLTYIEGDAQQLPLASACADVVSIAFGIRNVADPRLALSEFARVLRPAGRLIVLEFDQPGNPIMRWFNTMYCAKIMPRTATWISGDSSGAYAYLPASVGTFMSREQLAGSIAECGFERVETTGLSLGLCACYRALRA